MDTTYIAQMIMYFVFLFSIVAYITLDGFDMGVGCLHLFAKGDLERRIMINSIGPVWDGNATWIVIGGGVLLASFPKAFSVIGPNLYTPLMCMVFGFMLRAAAIEFRGKGHTKAWKNVWDVAFSFASLLLAIMLGIVLGNLVSGVPLNGKGEIEGGLAALLKPYPLLISLFGLSCFMMHGSIYLLMKTEGEFHDRIRHWVRRSILAFLILWFISTLVTFLYQPQMIQPFRNYPIVGVLPVLSFASIIMIVRKVQQRKDGMAFLFSCLTIFFLMTLFVIGLFPNILYSTLNPKEYSLTFMNSSVSAKALWILVGVTGTGVPLSFFYFPYIFRVFRGKVKLDSLSY